MLPSRTVLGQCPADRSQLSVYSAGTVCEPLVSSSLEAPMNGAFSQESEPHVDSEKGSTDLEFGLVSYVVTERLNRLTHTP